MTNRFDPHPMNSVCDVAALVALGLVADGERRAEVDSTQSLARRIVADLPRERLPYLIVADRQTAGRGRGENRWWTGAGSLALSLVFDPEHYGLERPARPARALAVGVALVDALAPVCPGAAIGLHWPNDVFLGERKLAGVLIDILPGERHILGLGVNTNNSLAAMAERPSDRTQPADGMPCDEAPSAEVLARAVSLVDVLGHEVDHTRLVASFLERLDAALRLSAADPPALGRRFAELCLQIGRRLVVEQPGGAATGLCLGIAADGALLLETDRGVETIYSGTLRRAGSA